MCLVASYGFFLVGHVMLSERWLRAQAVEDEEVILRRIRARQRQKEPNRRLSVSWKATWDEKADDVAKGTKQEYEQGKRRKSINYELFDVSRKVSERE